MKKRIVCVLMLALILINALNLAFIVSPSFAENATPGENPLEKTGTAPSSKITDKLNAQPNVSEEEPKVDEPSRDSEGKWSFNDTNEWSKFAYTDGNKTRLIVGVEDEKPNTILELEKIAAQHQGIIVNTISIRDKVKAVIVEILLTSVTAFVDEVRILKLVSYIEPNMKVQAQMTPNDPYWSYQWGPQKIQADLAWDTTIGNPSVLVAVVDTGVYYYHADLAANYVSLGYDWVNTDNDPLDDHGHGTHCAGIIAATLNNGVGMAGLAQVRVMAEKVLDSGGYGYWDWVANGIINATDCGADIISMSLGGYGDSELVHEAVKYAYDAGVLVIAAAGNDNTNMKLYPAGYDEVVAVAATDQSDNKAWFSNWGDWIELAAPGVDIYSTVPWGYESWSGTSMACPHVSGVAALVWSQYPSKTRDWVRLWLRYTADDLGDEGFDVYYGYGRVSARKAVAQSPPAHELILHDWETPPYVKPEASGIINATILNFGESNETNVTVQLLANGTIVNSTLIDLATGNVTTVSLAWSPSAEGLYNVTLFVVPVPSETSVENNALWKYIYAGVPAKAVVLHSAGNIRGDIITNWQVLNNEWYMFGDTMVSIDYTTLNKEDITYDDITATEADVLIISCAYDPSMGWQFTDSEIDAITQYVHEGHGLIATAGTLYSGVPNNNKLAPLFGLNEFTMWASTWTDFLNLLNVTHSLFRNVPNPLVFPQAGTALPEDGRWDSNELMGGEYIGLGHYQESAIVTYRGLVYISPWLEVIPPYYHHHLQLLYNAITWSSYQKPQHELIVSLEAPNSLKPSESVLLNATVFNNGLNSETDVELYLSIDDTVVNSTTIAELLTDSSCTINYLWTPTVEATYNVTAYAPPVPSEEITVNNQESKFVGVFEMVIAVVLDSWGTDYGYYAFWDYLNTNWAKYGTMRIIIDYTSLNKEDITLADIEATQADVLIISDAWEYGHGWEFADSEIEAIETYVRSGHGIIATSGTFNTMDGMAPNNRKLADLFGMDPDIEYRWGTYTSGTFDLLTPRHDELWRNISDPYLSDSIYTIYPYPSSDWTIQGVTTGWIEALSTDHYATVITSDAITHKAVYFTGMLESDGQYNENNRQLFYNAIVWTQLPLYEHELAVSLESPDFLEPGDSVLLNATVYNRGISNETSVELQLLINGTSVDSVMIPELLTGTAYTLSYLWTPRIEGIYNMTAYAPPVTGEELVADNVATKMVMVRYPPKLLVVDTPAPEDTGALDKLGYEYTLVSPTEFATVDLYEFNVLFVGWVPGDEVVNALFARASEIAEWVAAGNGIVALSEPSESNRWAWLPLWVSSNGYGGENVHILDPTHPVMSHLTDAELGYWWASYHGYFYSYQADWTALAQGIEAGYPITLAATYGAGRIVITHQDPDFHFYYNDVRGAGKLLRNMIEWATPIIRYEHELAVSLTVPASLELGSSTLLNATVRNTGLNNETDVSLYLLVNSTVVSSATIPELQVNEFYTINYLWTPTETGKYNVTAYAPLVPGEEYTANNVMTKKTIVLFFYRRFYFPHEWVGGGVPMGWHADDSSWQYTLPFDFPFYGINYRTIYISSNGLITFIGPDNSYVNSIPALADKLAISPAWDDWTSNEPYDIYIWEDSIHVGIRWNACDAFSSSKIVNFEAILSIDGVIQFNYEHNNGSVSTTIGISNGAGHILAEDVTSLDCINTIVFTPYLLMHDVAVINVKTSKTIVAQGYSVNINVTVANKGYYTETFNVTVYANITSIASQTLTLDSGNFTTLTFTWNTSGFAMDTYTIIAEAEVVEGETYTENNRYTDGVITVSVIRLGDFDGDSDVDEDDTWQFCAYFITYYKSGYEPKMVLFDFDGDFDVDENDLWTFCAAFINYYKST